MPIQHFMQSYKQAWETSDEHLLASLFVPDGCYHNTPFAVQRGHAQIKQYWQRTKLQHDITVTFEVLQASATRGIAHWHTTYQVTSEEMFGNFSITQGKTTRQVPAEWLDSRQLTTSRQTKPSIAAPKRQASDCCPRDDTVGQRTGGPDRCSGGGAATRQRRSPADAR